jgi:hypothetical protein
MLLVVGSHNTFYTMKLEGPSDPSIQKYINAKSAQEYHATE